MAILRDILASLWQAFLSLVTYFAERTAAAGIEVDPFILVPVALILTVWLGSAVWSASIATGRRHSTLFHFIIGLLIPYLYPLVIMFAMDIKGAKEREQMLRLQAEKEKAEEQERERIAGLVGRDSGPAAEPDRQVFDAAYFEGIARDDQGNPTGPWRIVFGDSEIKALRIIDPLPEVLSVEIEGRDGKPQKFRVPYARITECEPC